MSGKDTRGTDDRKVWNWGRDRNRDLEENNGTGLTGSGPRNRDRQESEKGRDYGDDNGRDKYRQRLNDRDRNRDRDEEHDRRRHRERDRDRGDRNDAIQGPIILLRRPAPPTTELAATTPSTKSSLNAHPVRESEREDHHSGRRKQSESCGRTGKEGKAYSTGDSSIAAVPVVLQRPATGISTKPNITEQKVPNHIEKKPTAEPSKEKPKPAELARNVLIPYKFQAEFALPIIKSNMKIRPLNHFNFFNERGRITGDYFVITAVGKPLSGKSTILSYLSDHSTKKGYSKIFSKRRRRHQMDSFLYITSDNVIFIEMASIFNCAAAHDLSSQQGTLENTSLTWDLKLMRWALAVSHIVLVVCDTVLDPNICQLISSAEMIHPLESALGEGVYPEIIFVCNNVSQSNLKDEKLLQKYQFMLNTVAGRNPRIQPNFFMLPQRKSRNSVDWCEELNSAIFKFVHYNRAPHLPELKFAKIPQKYNAHDWYCNVTKIWEAMQHPNYFASYVKLCP